MRFALKLHPIGKLDVLHRDLSRFDLHYHHIRPMLLAHGFLQLEHHRSLAEFRLFCAASLEWLREMR